MIELHDGRVTERGELKARYNFTKKHCSLKDWAPAEQALTAVDGKNEWIALTQDASLHKERDDATGVKYASSSSSSSFLVFFLLTYAPILTVFAYLIARRCIELFIKDRFDSGADLFAD